MPQPMTGSSDTNTGRPARAPSRDRAHHRRRAARVDRDVVGGAALGQRALERRGHAAALAAAAVLGGQDELAPSASKNSS